MELLADVYLAVVFFLPQFADFTLVQVNGRAPSMLVYLLLAKLLLSSDLERLGQRSHAVPKV